MPKFQMDAGWRPFHPNPSKPKFRPPPGAVDAHCHVFGPGDDFPYAPERKYTPCDAPAEKLFELRDFLGFDKNVIVQATCHGSDNRALVDALRKSNGKAKGVATVRPDTPDAELQEMTAAGVLGARFNFVRRLADPKPKEYYDAIIDRLVPLGWHLVIYFEPPDLYERWDFFNSLTRTPVIIDHMGTPDVTKGVDHPDFQKLVELMDRNPNYWCKTTCPDRLSKQGAPYDDVVPYAKYLVERFPDRVLWGTDWPHPNLKTHMPDDGVLTDFVPRIAETEELQRKLLIDNPIRLYWS